MIEEAVDIGRLQVAKVKCMKSLLFHTRYFFKAKFNRKFVIGEHHIKICEALEKVLSGEITRLIINIAPRYGKTELAVKNLISHGLSLNPSAKFIHLSYSDDLALDNSEEVRELVQQEYYQQIFSNVEIKKDSNAKKKWYTTEGGGVYATSASGQVTGFGAGQVDDEDAELTEFMDNIDQKKGFGGAIIIDDPIKPEDAESETVRDKVNQRFDSTIRNRVNSRNTPIIIIMQRVHEQDLSGYLMDIEPGIWTVLSLPCIKPDNTALWPFKHTIEELRALEALNELVFDRQYQQNPTSKAGKLFPKEELNFYNPATVDVEKHAEFKAGSIDPSDTGGDALAFPVGYLVGNKIYIPKVIYNTDGTDINEPACVELIVANKLNYVTIEGNAAWILFGKAVRNAVQERHEDCEVRIIKNTTNKHTRIWAMSAFIKNNFIFRLDYKDFPEYESFMKNLFSYNKSQEGSNKNKHEDAADAAAELAKYFQSNFTTVFT